MIPDPKKLIGSKPKKLSWYKTPERRELFWHRQKVIAAAVRRYNLRKERNIPYAQAPLCKTIVKEKQRPSLLEIIINVPKQLLP